MGGLQTLLMEFLVVFIILPAIVGPLSVTYKTDYAKNGGYYIISEHNVNLICNHKGMLPFIVTWKVGQSTDTTIFEAKYVDPGCQSAEIEIYNTAYKHKIISYSCSETEHSITVRVNREEDNGQYFECDVTDRNTAARYSPGVWLDNILAPPVSVSLSKPGYFVDGKSTYIQCTVSSVYPGKDNAEFKLKVGSQYYTQHVETEEDVGLNKNITASFTPVFNRAQQDNVILYEIIWMRGTSAQIVKESDTQSLHIYYPATSVSEPSVSPNLPLLEDTEITLSCTSDSFPFPRLRLYREGASDTLKEVVNITLTWSKTMNRTDHGDQYYCKADDAGRYPGWEFSVASDKLRIEVLFQASSVSVESIVPSPVEEGGTIQVICHTEGNPEPILTLYRSGDDGRDKVQLESVSSSILHTNISIQRDINMVPFYCTARSSQREVLDYFVASNQLYYAVKFLPVSNTLDVEASDPLLSGHEISLTCITGSANPGVGFMIWTKGGTEVTSGVTSETLLGEFGGKILESSYTFTLQKFDNEQSVSCTPFWNGQKLTDLMKQIQLDVVYPPVVTLNATSSPAEEGSNITLNCIVTDGNPKSLTHFYWEIQPGSNPRVLPERIQSKELRMESVVYTDAGTYRCTAGNTVGNDTGEIQIIVHYQPKLLTSGTTAVVYSDLYQEAVMTITVRACPGFDDLQSAFIWQKTTGEILNNLLVTSYSQNHNIFLSKMVIDPVEAENYGKYMVTVHNNFKGPVTFTLELRPKGPPNSVTNISIQAVAAEQAVIAWLAGSDGGSEQTFKIIIREVGSNTERLIYTNHRNPPEGDLLNFTVMNLKPETKYIVSVISENLYGEDRSGFIDLVTREKPVVNQDYLKVNIDKEVALLTWYYGVEEQAYILVMIEQCQIDKRCAKYDVTQNTNQTLEVSVSDGNIFYLVIYQDGLEAYRSEMFTEIFKTSVQPNVARTIEQTAHTKSSAPVGGIAGGTLATTVVIVVVVICICFYRGTGRYKQKSREMDGGTSEMPVYINVTPKDPAYQDIEKCEVTEAPVYQELTKLDQ